MVWPGLRLSLSWAPLASLYAFTCDLSSWYTLCGMPESTPRSPWNGVRFSTGLFSAGKVEAVSLPLV